MLPSITFDGKLTKVCVPFGERSTDMLTIWFSYETPVAVQFPGDAHPFVCRNQWSQTTGRHLNTIDGGDNYGRVDYEEFEEILAGLRNAVS